jgi:YD repeat-containing protein
MNSGKQWMAVVILLACSVAGVAQTSPDLEQGMKPYGSYHGGNLDNISLTNGNLYFEAPLFSYSQRGDLAYPIVLRYNNKNFSIYQPPCPPPTHCPVRQTVIFGPSPVGGDSSSDGASVTLGFAGYPTTGGAAINTSLSFDGNAIFYNSNSVVGPDGATHQLVTTSSGAVTADGSGFAVNSRGLVDRNGTLSGGLTAEDRNGNQISINANTTISSDTLGRHFPLAPGPTLPANTPPASTAPLTSCPALNYAHQPVSYAYYWSLSAPNTPPSTGSMQLVVCYASVYVRTNFLGGATGPNLFDVSSTFYMLQSVVFPDQTYWAFQYDAADPNNTASYGFGDLLKVSLPIGGSLSYTWGPWAGGTCSGSGYSRAVLTRTVDANDGTGPHTWTYNGGVVTDPLGNDTVHTTTHLGGTCSIYETQTQYYQGSHTGGTLLKTVNTDYQYTVNPYDGAVIASNGVQSLATSVTNVFPIRVTTTLSNGLVSKVETDYDTALAYHGPLDGITSNQLDCPPPTDPPNGCFYGSQVTNGVTNYTGSYGKVMAKREYDWGHGAPGPLLRQTVYSYQWQNGTNAASYLSNNFLDLVSTAIVYDGASNQVAKTTYAYDESTLGSSNIATQRDSNPGNGLIRGNQTTVSHWLNTSNSMISSHAAYFDTGELQSSTDPLNHTTTHLYDSAYAGAFSTQTCSPSTNGGTVTHCVSGTYDFNTGLLTSLTNENATTQASGNSPGDSAHTSSFSYDLYWRLLSAKAPPDPANSNMQDTTTFTYSLLPLMVTRQKSVTTGLNDSASAYFDGVGRSFKSTHTLPNGTATTVTTFDAAGRTSTVTNPYFTTSDPTYGVTQSIYDGLGRATQVIKQDGSISQVKYNVPNALGLNADCTTTTDEAGKQRGACTDALGRLVEVDEPYASGLLINNYATLQSGGNFVLESSANSTLWSTGTSGTNASSIFMQDDGNLVLYIFKWSAGTYAAPTPGSYPQASCSIGTYLVAGQTLPSGSCIASPHWQYFLYMAPDGNLYIYNWATGAGTWGPGTQGHPGAYARLETNGNFVVYASNGATLWSSGTSGTNAERLDMEDDGRIILYKSAWNSGTSTGQFNWSQLAHPGCDAGIGTGTTGMLGAGQCFVSPNGHFELLMQTDGNLVIYDLGATPAAALWSTGTGISPVDPGYSMRTLYTYDTLGNLLRVEQRGGTTDSTQWRVRTFTYNSLSQLLTATNPESGTISYVYDNDGNLLQKTSPAPNQTGTATQIVSYCYDEQHRITGKGYGAQSCPLATPVVSYVYDSGANAKGHLTSMTDQAGTASYTFDVLGRMSTETRSLTGANNGAISKTVSYEYNLDGSLKVLHYPSGAAVTYTPWNNGSAAVSIPQDAKDLGSGINYASGGAYGPDLSLTNFVSGSGGAAAITNTFTYNKRLQPVNMSAVAGSQTVFSIGYDFHLGNGDNGNVFGITNYKDSNRNQTFTYDPLNRVISAQNAGTDCTAKVLQNKTEYWGNSYTYDAWGNLLGKTITKCGAENLNLTADAHNWIHGPGTDYRYDAAGNMTYDATANLNYTFDRGGRDRSRRDTQVRIRLL